MIPNGMPRTIAKIMATIDNSIVAGNLIEITSRTGRKLVDALIPQSPWNKLERYKKYWMCRGSSNPCAALMEAIAPCGVFSLIYMETGSPTTYARNHVIVRTPKTTGIASKTLLSMKSRSFI
jgi:hypothetical protein